MITGIGWQTQYVLEIQGSGFKKIVFLKKIFYSLGRSLDNSIILPFENVSDYHATLVKITDEQNNRYFYGLFDGNIKEN